MKTKSIIRFTPFILALVLLGCRPPVPDVDQAVEDADPNRIISISNEGTAGYFSTALPFEPSPTRGLIHQSTVTVNRADMEQLERSMMRVATDFFDPDAYYLREGQTLSWNFATNVLSPFDEGDENSIGLNPPIGSEHRFGNETIRSRSRDQVRHLSYISEHNFVTTSDGEFQLEGVSITLAMNPFYLYTDRSRGVENLLYMSENEIIAIGQEMADELLPLLRDLRDPSDPDVLLLEGVPILLGIFVLESHAEITPGRLAAVNFIEADSNRLGAWETVHERHFNLQNSSSDLNEYDPNIYDEFTFFANSIESHYPHHSGITGQAHIVDGDVYRVNIVFNMHFLGFSEKLSFHQLVAQFANEFSPEYDVRIIVRSPNNIHGAVTRPPFSEADIHMISW